MGWSGPPAPQPEGRALQWRQQQAQPLHGRAAPGSQRVEEEKEEEPPPPPPPPRVRAGAERKVRRSGRGEQQPIAGAVCEAVELWTAHAVRARRPELWEPGARRFCGAFPAG